MAMKEDWPQRPQQIGVTLRRVLEDLHIPSYIGKTPSEFEDRKEPPPHTRHLPLTPSLLNGSPYPNNANKTQQRRRRERKAVQHGSFSTASGIIYSSL